jgi:signal transduction histidine kinase
MLGPQGRVMAAALMGAVAALALSFWIGLVAAVPLAVSVGGASAVLAGWPRSRSWLDGTAALAAVTSLAATSTRLLASYRFPSAAALVGLVEVAALALLLLLVVRWSPPRRAVMLGVLVGFAAAAWIIRIVPESSALGLLGALASWAPVPIAAAAAGGYGRRANNRRRRAVVEAQRAQRLGLARDLHDFVAHDVTGIVVQAQAAQFAGSDDPRVAAEALRRIEEAGLQALSSMDKALEMLRAEPDIAVTDPGVLSEPTGLRELPRLLARFSTGAGTVIDAHVDRELVEQLPEAVSAVAYRVVVEGLTNVRRHAPHATRVEVRIAGGSRSCRLEVSLINDLPHPLEDALPRDAVAGGAGLPELTRLVRDMGGDLSAGPHDGGWRLTAWLPLTPGRP